MISRTTVKFRRAYQALPADVRQQARAAYHRFRQDPFYSSLQFKRIHRGRQIYSVRVNRDYRALGVLHGDEVVWFWIGPHSAYDQLLRRL